MVFTNRKTHWKKMKLYNYNSYEEYVNAQIEGNMRKIKNSYVDPVSLSGLVGHLYEQYSLKPATILCHGTRRGLEQQYFLDIYKSLAITPNVIGTEISPTAVEYPNTIQWDFHEVKDEWVGSIDLIYSNSFDHSYKPTDCLKAWMSCLSDKGVCVIEYSEICDTKSGVTDPFGASLQEYKEFISKDYEILEILNNSGLEDRGESYQGLRYYILVRNR
jgi:hypothetical protein